MSTLKTGALRGTSGTADSVQLHASNQSVTFPGAVTVSGGLTGGGKLLQVVNNPTACTATQDISSTTTWTDFTNLTLSITPSAATSKIFIVVNACLKYQVASAADFQAKIRIQKTIGGSTTDVIMNGIRLYDYSSAGNYWVGMQTMMKLDAPNTTSAITYKVGGYMGAGTQFSINKDSTGENESTLTAFEIGA